jgi:hypothetical protein
VFVRVAEQDVPVGVSRLFTTRELVAGLLNGGGRPNNKAIKESS